MTTISNSNIRRQRKKRHTDTSGNGTIPTPSFDSILQNLASHALDSITPLDSSKPLDNKDNSHRKEVDDEIECIEEVPSFTFKRHMERLPGNTNVISGSELLHPASSSSFFVIPRRDKHEARAPLMSNNRNIYGIRIAPPILRRHMVSRSSQDSNVSPISTPISSYRRVYLPDTTPISCRISAPLLRDRNVSQAVVFPTRPSNFVTTNTNGAESVSFCNNCTAEFPKIIKSLKRLEDRIDGTISIIKIEMNKHGGN